MSFTVEDVRRQLALLGFHDVPQEVLDNFMQRVRSTAFSTSSLTAAPAPAPAPAPPSDAPRYSPSSLSSSSAPQQQRTDPYSFQYTGYDERKEPQQQQQQQQPPPPTQQQQPSYQQQQQQFVHQQQQLYQYEASRLQQRTDIDGGVPQDYYTQQQQQQQPARRSLHDVLPSRKKRKPKLHQLPEEETPVVHKDKENVRDLEAPPQAQRPQTASKRPSTAFARPAMPKEQLYASLPVFRPSTARPGTLHVALGGRRVRKADPVSRYHEYKRAWDTDRFLVSGSKQRK